MPIQWIKVGHDYECSGLKHKGTKYAFKITPLKGSWYLIQMKPFNDRIGFYDTLAQAKARVERMKWD